MFRSKVFKKALRVHLCHPFLDCLDSFIFRFSKSTINGLTLLCSPLYLRKLPQGKAVKNYTKRIQKKFLPQLDKSSLSILLALYGRRFLSCWSQTYELGAKYIPASWYLLIFRHKQPSLVLQWKQPCFFCFLVHFSKEKAVKQWKQFTANLNSSITHYCSLKVDHFSILQKAFYWSVTFECFSIIQPTNIFEIHFTFWQVKVHLPGEETFYLNNHFGLVLLLIYKMISLTWFEVILKHSKKSSQLNVNCSD